MMRRVLLGALTALLAASAAVVPASGQEAPAPPQPTPAQVQLDRAIKLQDQIEANGEKLAALGEEYNRVQLQQEEAQDRANRALEQLTETTTDVENVRKAIETRAAFVYRRNLAVESLEHYDVKEGQKLLARQQYAEAQAQHDDKLLHRLVRLQRAAGDEAEAARLSQAEVEAHRVAIEKTRQDVLATTNEYRALIEQMRGDLMPLVTAEQQRRALAALKAAQERYDPSALGDGDPSMFPNEQAPSAAATVAIYYALAQVGKPYLYAASGPDSFDCSGLVMAAYAAAGVPLVHYSGAQYAMLPHVGFDQMLPGDLLFWGPNGSKHVAIYVGAGRIIEAGGTSHDVHVGPIWGEPVGAARPVPAG